MRQVQPWLQGCPVSVRARKDCPKRVLYLDPTHQGNSAASVTAHQVH